MKIIYSCILIAQLMLLGAQPVQWEHEIDLEKNTSFLNIPYADSGGIYISLGNGTNLDFYSNKLSYAAFGKLNYAYQPVFMSPYLGEGGHFEQLGLIRKENKFVNYLQYDDIHAYRVVLKTYFTNSAGKAYRNPLTTTTFDLDLLKCKQIKTHFAVSPDSSKVVTISEREGVQAAPVSLLNIPLNKPGENRRQFKNEDKFVFINVHSREGSLIWQKLHMMGENKEKDIIIEDCAIDTRGKVYILYKSETRDSLGKALNDKFPLQTTWYDYMLYCSAGDSLGQIIPVDIPGYFIGKPHLYLSSADTNTIMCTGSMLSTGTKAIAGVFTHTLNVKNFTTRTDTFSWETDTRKYLAANDEFKFLQDGSSGFEIRQIHTRKNGGLFVLAEYIDRAFTGASKGFGPSGVMLGSPGFQTNKDILIISVGPDHSIDWTKVIPKHTTAEAVDLEFSSFFSFLINDDLYVLYNDIPENYDRVPAETYKTPVKFSFSAQLNLKIKTAKTLLFKIGPDRKYASVAVDPIDESNRLVSMQTCLQLPGKEKELLLTSSRKNKPVKIGRLIIP